MCFKFLAEILTATLLIMPFHFLYFWCFDIWGLTNPGETVPPRATVPGDIKHLSCKHTFHMQVNQS